jgi:hypothetical protein
VSAVTSILPLRNGEESGGNVVKKVKNKLDGATSSTNQSEPFAPDKSYEEVVEEEEEDEYGFL